MISYTSLCPLNLIEQCNLSVKLCSCLKMTGSPSVSYTIWANLYDLTEELDVSYGIYLNKRLDVRQTCCTFAALTSGLITKNVILSLIVLWRYFSWSVVPCCLFSMFLSDLLSFGWFSSKSKSRLLCIAASLPHTSGWS